MEHTDIPRQYGRPGELIRPAQPSVVHFPGTLKIHPGQSHAHVLLAKAMLQALRGQCPEFQETTMDQRLDRATEENLRHIQRCAGLPEDGVLDKYTWNRLCMLYRAMFDRYHPPTQG